MALSLSWSWMMRLERRLAAQGRRLRSGTVGLVVALLVLVPVASGSVVPAEAATGVFTGMSVTADGQGYVLVSAAGEVYAFGTVEYHANPRGFTGQITDIAVTADGRGYVAVSTTGQVYAYGTVVYRGNPSGFTGSIVGIAVTEDGQGYVAVSSSGQTYAYGTVTYRGNASGFSGQINDVTATRNGSGYAMVSSTGQVYAFGTIQYHANPRGFTGSIVDITTTGDGSGYAAISSSGQVYAYGTVTYRGNPAGFTGSIVAISTTGTGAGYAAASSTGQMYAYGVTYRGNADAGYVDGPATGQILYYNVCGNKGNTNCPPRNPTFAMVDALRTQSPLAMAINEICLNDFADVKAQTGYNGQFVASSAQTAVNCANSRGQYGNAVFYRGQAAHVDKGVFVAQTTELSVHERRSFICISLRAPGLFTVCTAHLNRYDAQQQELRGKLATYSASRPTLFVGDINRPDPATHTQPAAMNASGDGKVIFAMWSRNVRWEPVAIAPSRACLPASCAPLSWTDHPGYRLRIVR